MRIDALAHEIKFPIKQIDLMLMRNAVYRVQQFVMQLIFY
jgi:hypothetical protein